MFIKRIVQICYGKFVPSVVRNARPIVKLRAYLLGHDWIYDSDYYRLEVESSAISSAKEMANSIYNELSARRIIDVGCGTGALLASLRSKGCEVFGLEYSKAGLKYCRARHLDVARFDLEQDDFKVSRTFDVAVSMEVAEHLHEIFADRYITLLTGLAPVIVFSAAPPGQEGTGHINLQLPSYWINKFEQHGFKHAEELSSCWSEKWQANGVAYYYCQNLMIFQRL